MLLSELFICLSGCLSACVFVCVVDSSKCNGQKFMIFCGSDLTKQRSD